MGNKSSTSGNYKPETCDPKVLYHVPPAYSMKSSKLNVGEDGLLGKGTYGEVFAATAKDDIKDKAGSIIVQRGQNVAIKRVSRTHHAPPDDGGATVKMTSDEVASLHTECEIGMMVNHPNLVRMYAVHMTRKYIYIVQESMSGGELFDAIIDRYNPADGSEPQPYSEKDVAGMLKQLGEALAYLHEMGIAHRDLKPENMLFKDNTFKEIKIMDFGLAKHLNAGQSMMTTSCGSPTYYAPEVMVPSPGGYDVKCDVWSLAVIMYIMMCGLPPFYLDDGSDIRHCRWEFVPEFAGVSEEAKDLISQCLVKNPDARPSMREFLQHPWMSNNIDTKLSNVGVGLREFCKGRRRWKNAITAVRFQNMMKSLGSSAAEDEDSDGDGPELLPSGEGGK